MSFSDMMSSGRGPGVIGMLMALLVLVGFGVLFMFAFDEGLQGGSQSIESVVRHQGDEIINQREAIKRGQETLRRMPAMIAAAKEVPRMKQKIQFAQDEIVSLKQGVASASAEVANQEKTFEDYKNEYRKFVRTKAKGQQIEEIVTKNGTIYKKVEIRQVTPVGIQIRHEEGQKRIAFEELPDDLVDYFQFDPAQKVSALAEELATRNEHESAVAEASDQADAAMAADKQKKAQERKEQTIRMIAQKESRISSLKEEISGLENEMKQAEAAAASARAAGRMHINKSSNISAVIRSRQGQIAALQSEIYQLSSSIKP